MTFVRRTFIANNWVIWYPPFSSVFCHFDPILRVMGWRHTRCRHKDLNRVPCIKTWRMKVACWCLLLQCFCAVLGSSKYSILARCSNLASKRLMRHTSIPSPFYASKGDVLFCKECENLQALQRDGKFSSFLVHGVTSFCACMDVSNWRQRRGFGDQVAGFPLCHPVAHSFSFM